jgi:hypothetical protein
MATARTNYPLEYPYYQLRSARILVEGHFVSTGSQFDTAPEIDGVNQIGRYWFVKISIWEDDSSGANESGRSFMCMTAWFGSVLRLLPLLLILIG